jgi:hypothetical protein
VGTIWPGTKEIDAYGRWTGRVYNAMGCQWTDSPMYPGTDAGRLNLDRRIRDCPPSSTPPEPPLYGPKLTPKTWPSCVTVSGCFEGRITVQQSGCAREAYGPDTDPKVLEGTTSRELAEVAPALINRLRCREAPAITLRTRSFAELHADEATAAHLCAEVQRALECAGAPKFGIQFFGMRHNVKSTEQRYQLRIFPLY